MVQQRDDVVLIDASILAPPAVWEASGHLANFTDPLVDCTNCKQRFRADHLEEPDVCPNCGAKDSFTEARAFNLMFKTQAGPVEGPGADVYLRPETAQGMFVNFANVLQTTRKKPPFGIAQIGKSFRNEITPGNFIFRTREFEQMEIEFFVPPADGPKWYEYWCNARLHWYVDLGIQRDMLRLRPHDADELAHYSAGTSDVEYLFPWGWGELEGIAQRTDYDLKQHADALGREARLLRPGDERALRAVRHRARGGRDPRRWPRSCSPRTTRTRSTARPARCCGCTRASRRTRWRCCRCRRRTSSSPLRTHFRSLAAVHVRLRRHAVDRQALPPPGRDRDAVVRHRRLRLARGPRRDHPRPGHDRAGAGADRPLLDEVSARLGF